MVEIVRHGEALGRKSFTASSIICEAKNGENRRFGVLFLFNNGSLYDTPSWRTKCCK